MKKIVIMSTLLLSSWSVALAQKLSAEATTENVFATSQPIENAQPVVASKENEEPKLSVKPTGRILFDAALFAPKNQKDVFNDGFGIPDARAGVAAKYGKWYGKIDIGYAYGKVGLKDILMQYTFNKHQLIKGGYFVHQFGLQSATSSSFKISMEEPMSQGTFGDSRLLGLMYVHDLGKFFGTFSFFTESNSMKMPSDQLGNQGFGMMSRLLYKPFTEDGNILHLGISGAFETPQYDKAAALNHKVYTLAAPFPTRVAKIPALQAKVEHAKRLFKVSPEIAAAKGKLGIEAQYYYLTITRENGFKNYKASGAYCSLRGLIKGSDYSYTHTDGGIDTPKPGSMELVAAYNYTDLSDNKAEILGGRANDWSLTYNYYLNKYMIWRLRASYTKVTDCAIHENNHVGILETRLQIKF